VPTVARRGFAAALFAAGERAEWRGCVAVRLVSVGALVRERDCVGLNPRTLSWELEP
jgi:hypothetical protein